MKKLKWLPENDLLLDIVIIVSVASTFYLFVDALY